MENDSDIEKLLVLPSRLFSFLGATKGPHLMGKKKQRIQSVLFFLALSQMCSGFDTPTNLFSLQFTASYCLVTIMLPSLVNESV